MSAAVSIRSLPTPVSSAHLHVPWESKYALNPLQLISECDALLK